MAVDFFDDGKQRPNFREFVTLGDSFKNNALNQLLRSVGSLQSQGLNRLSDQAAASGLPMASQLAQQRAIGIGANQQLANASVDLEKFIAQQNISGNQFLLQMAAAQQQAKDQRKEDRFNSILGAIGQIGGSAGFLLGGGG